MRHHTSDFKHQNFGLLRTSVFQLRTIILFGLLTSVFGLSSCKKEKFDPLHDDRAVPQNRANSTVRIVNLADFTQVIANGDSLTNYKVEDIQGGPPQYPGTDYFPTDGRLGSTWTVPQDLFGADGTAHLTLDNLINGNGTQEPTSLTVTDDYNNPTDYMIMPTYFTVDGTPAVIPVKRGISSPAQPDHFKIRIVNLCSAMRFNTGNAHGPMDNLVGPVTLAYADGTPVSPATTKISQHQLASDYVEVPYGTYQFKVLTEDGRQFPGSGWINNNNKWNYIDPPTSSPSSGLSGVSNLPYASIQTYQPGGVYTILVYPGRFNLYTDDLNNESPTFQNTFKVIADISAPVNTTYSRIQGVNALPDATVSFSYNGEVIGKDLAFGDASPYMNHITSTGRLEALAADGSVLATLDAELRAGQNYSTWLYPATDGAPKLLLVANDLGNVTYSDNVLGVGNQGDDGSLSHYRMDFMFKKRFLNLSPDIPFASFTEKDGQAVDGSARYASDEAVYNLQPGLVPTDMPYSWGGGAAGYELMLYRSSPDVTPGTWAEDIPVLHGIDFIARKGLYEEVGRDLPNYEPGVFSVALIGRTGPSVPAAAKARMIIVKHTK